MPNRADDRVGAGRSLLNDFAELQTYFTFDDRRQWLVLLGVSLATGMIQSLILALFNDAAARHATGGSGLLHLSALIGLIAAGMASGYLGTLTGHKISSRVAIRLRNVLLDRIGAANLQLLDRVGASTVHFHLMATIERVANAYGLLLSFTSAAVMLICNFVYLGWLSPLGLTSAAVITAIGVIVHFQQEASNFDRRIRVDRLSNRVSGRHWDMLSGYKELRMSRAKTADYRGRLDRDSGELAAVQFAVARTGTIGDLATSFFQFILIFFLIFALPQYIRIDSVVLLQMMGAIFITMGPLTSVVGAIPDFAKVRAALYSLRDLQCEIDATQEPPVLSGSRKLSEFESLEMRDVEFGFADGPQGDGFRLGPINLSIRRGELLFLIGGNGSGKTMLLRVLTGLYHQDHGIILYNGRTVEGADRQAYREQFSTVFGDFHLFKEMLGSPGFEESLVQGWLERLDLADKIRISGGEFSSLALSAGQRKRLAYLVAVLEDRPIMVLDEFGAEQDPGHRRKFYRELLPELRSRGKTVIVVTHDDAYFDVSDRIVKMDFGQIAGDTAAVGIHVPPAAMHRQTTAGSGSCQSGATHRGQDAAESITKINAG